MNETFVMPADDVPAHDVAPAFLDRVAELLTLGGPVVTILLAISIVGLAIILLKLFQFVRLRAGSRGFIAPALAHWSSRRPHAALEILESSPSPIARVMETAIRGLSRPGIGEDKVREEVTRVAAGQVAMLQSHLRGLEVIAILAPLLGLFGTVLGMISAFQDLQMAGARADPSVLAGGIWEALLTTAVGLAVAIPAAAALNWLESIVDRVRHAIEDSVTQLFTSELALDRNEAVEPPAILAGQEHHAT